jgi:putative ABC transport system permease protein
MVFVLHTAGDPAALTGDVRRAIGSVDPAQPLFDVMPMRQVLGERTIGLQYVATIMMFFAGLALVLAVLGLYAVMSYLVAQRVREIGVRIALGATPSDISKLALGHAARLTAVGVGLGLALAFAVERLIESALLGIVSASFSTPLLIAAVLAAVALASSYLPARRAAAVDPMIALRAE